MGDLPKPGTSPTVPARAEYGLQPVTTDTLGSASEWVKSWPEARGHTNLVSALSLCRSRWDEIGVPQHALILPHCTVLLVAC